MTAGERSRGRADAGRSILMRSFGTPNAVLDEFDFWDRRYEGRRLFSELFGTFLLVLVAVGGGMVNARFGGSAVPYGALVVAPALMVAAIILFMGAVSGAHLNPAVSIAFALRGDFPWRRVPAYIVAQLLGAVAATLLLAALIGTQGSAGLTLPGHGISPLTAMLWEIVLTTGLVSTILGVVVRRPAAGTHRRRRRRQLHRPGRPVGLAGERRLHESRPLPGPGARPRTTGRRGGPTSSAPSRARSSRWGSPTSCAARAVSTPAAWRPKEISALTFGAEDGSERPLPGMRASAVTRKTAPAGFSRQECDHAQPC